jgi:hypothetical protein
LLSDLRRVGVKFFLRDGNDIPLVDFIPVFHRWIQTSAVDGVLIDVADYSHVPEGPGVILVAHEGIYSVDESGGRRGLAYLRRRAPERTFDDALSAALRAGARACRLLEEEFNGTLRFRGNELAVFAPDRLLAPNDDRTMSELRPSLDALGQRLFQGTAFDLRRELDGRDAFTVAVRSPVETAFSDLAGRILG